MFNIQNGVRGDWAELGRTETLANNLEPEWQTSLSLRYHFHQRQLLRLCDALAKEMEPDSLSWMSGHPSEETRLTDTLQNAY